MSGTVRVNLRGDHTLDRRRLFVLEGCPDGATVRVEVGARWFVSPDAARWLHTHADRLFIEIIGTDPVVVQRFIDAARTGSCEAIA